MREPILENDPANIAYALDGHYYSFYTLRRLSDQQLRELFRSFDLTVVALDVPLIDLVTRILAACHGRAATYSEGHLMDYQRLSPSGQAAFVKALRQADINFIYWEQYVPFYRTLTNRPVEYLPYPYILDQAQSLRSPLEKRGSVITVPSGLAGQSRNGLATLNVAKCLLDAGLVGKIICWLEASSFDEDRQAINSLFFGGPDPKPSGRLNWRDLLHRSGVDYRPLLRLKRAFHRGKTEHKISHNEPETRITYVRRTGWVNYLTSLAQSRLLIELNNRETVGRNALDCAALGVACISTSRTDMQRRLFPWTTLENSWDVEGACNMCEQLLGEPSFYKQVVEYAEKAVQKFDPASFHERFYDLMSLHFKPISLRI